MKIVIVGASPELCWDKRWKPDLVICADGGLNAAYLLGLKPDLLIGDADSGGVSDTVPFRRASPEKEESDLQLCADRAVELGAKEIVLLGATGGRLDHFMGNIGMLERLARCGIDAVMLNLANELRVYQKPLCFEAPQRYRYFSLIPLDKQCEGVTLEGAKYPLDDATLYRGDTRGLSNEAADDDKPVSIRVGAGTALIIRSELRTVHSAHI